MCCKYNVSSTLHHGKHPWVVAKMVWKTTTCLALIAAVSISSLKAWSPTYHHSQWCITLQHLRGRERQQRTIAIVLASDDDESLGEQVTGDKMKDETNKLSEGKIYGVSYIGGDPCGSKYNIDPFDDESKNKYSFKPGFPDDMRERIAALAVEKLAMEKEKKDR